MDKEINNFTYDELSIGQRATYEKRVTERDIFLFSELSGDINPVHLDEAYASNTLFKGRIAHGMLTGAIVSAAIALELPGPGTIYLGQTLSFLKPVRIDDYITVVLEVKEKRIDVSDKGHAKHIVILTCQAFNQHEKLVAKGEAEVLAPTLKTTIQRPKLSPNID